MVDFVEFRTKFLNHLLNDLRDASNLERGYTRRVLTYAGSLSYEGKQLDFHPVTKPVEYSLEDLNRSSSNKEIDDKLQDAFREVVNIIFAEQQDECLDVLQEYLDDGKNRFEELGFFSEIETYIESFEEIEVDVETDREDVSPSIILDVAQQGFRAKYDCSSGIFKVPGEEGQINIRLGSSYETYEIDFAETSSAFFSYEITDVENYLLKNYIERIKTLLNPFKNWEGHP